MTIFLVVSLAVFLSIAAGYMLFDINARRNVKVPVTQYHYNKEQLENIGLKLKPRQRSIHAYHFPVNASYDVVFAHPDYVIDTKYNFDTENTYFVQGSYVSLEQMINLSMGDEIKDFFARIHSNVQAFKEKHNLDTSNKTLVPLMYIFGDNIDYIRKAISTTVEPSILAALVSKYGTEIMDSIESINSLPIEWIANMYELEYTVMQKQPLGHMRLAYL